MSMEFAFVASTGRTATTFVARVLADLPGVKAMHEGHDPRDKSVALIPKINLQNRKAWYEPAYARQVVSELRSQAILAQAAADAQLCIDAAYYNSPLLDALLGVHPHARFLLLFRRCEAFVRSATIVHGEDREPAGWPAPEKPLTPREQFISMGRLKPRDGTPEAMQWESWSGVSRNIWLWHTVNRHLLGFAQRTGCNVLFHESLLDTPREFWNKGLHGLGILNDENLQHCVAASARRINARDHYDVGPLESWSFPEREMYAKLALPLEKEIYG